VVVVASVVEEATVAECLRLLALSAVPIERGQREDVVVVAQEGLHHMGLLPRGQGGRGELEAGGTPHTFDPGKVG